MVVREQFQKAKQAAESFVVGTMQKYDFGTFGRTSYQRASQHKPIYERQYSPQWIKGIARQQSLVNNSIEEKVNQAFRRGFDSWEKKYEAKCPNCSEEFHSVKRFAKQIGQEPGDMEMDDLDFTKRRLCPECEEIVDFEVPHDDLKDYGQKFYDRANEREDTNLVPNQQASVSQTFLGVCKEVAWDIQQFDDGWMIFEKSYQLDNEGNVESWVPEGVYRAPPDKMRYSLNEEEKFGGEYWVCIECRSSNPDDYSPQESPGHCEECGNRTYEVFAYLLSNPQGEPVQHFIKGEFAHDSEYRPTRLYGLSPIISIADEAQTLDQMDSWYRSAYSERRAPRGAIVLDNQQTESVRAWTREQTEKLNNDSQHIPVFMGDGDGSSRPIEWISLLEEPAQMQNMQMREWFLDRVAAKFGVTAVFQNANAQSTGLSQSLEVVVSNRSAQRLQQCFENTFLPAFHGFLRIEGWTRSLKAPEEEDEQAIEQMMGRRLQNVQTASDLGFEVEWTSDDDYDIKPNVIGTEDEEGEDDGDVDGLFGPKPKNEESTQSNPSEERVTTEESTDVAGQTSTSGGRPQDAESMGGKPSQPDTPTTDNPIRAGEGTVTADTGGYRNVTYGGKPAEAIDILEDIRESDNNEEKTNKVEQLRGVYNECVKETNGGLPTYEQIERSVLQRPDKGYRAFRRSNSGDWATNYESEQFVKEIYQFIESRINE